MARVRIGDALFRLGLMPVRACEGQSSECPWPGQTPIRADPRHRAARLFRLDFNLCATFDGCVPRCSGRGHRLLEDP